MKFQKLLLSVFLSCTFWTAIAQYTIPAPSGDPCIKITQEKMRVFEKQLRELLTLAERDKAAYGTSGAYPATAVNFYTHAKLAVDTARKIVDWLGSGGDGNPAVTLYSEASFVGTWVGSIMDNLQGALWWGSLSSIYHKSIHASCGKEKTLQLLAETVNLLTYSYRCYTGAYKEIPPCK